MISIWLALYLMCGACAGTFYACACAFDFDRPAEWWAIPVVAVISMLLVVVWPLWIGGFAVCWMLDRLGVIG